jgi:hypothetical protein
MSGDYGSGTSSSTSPLSVLEWLVATWYEGTKSEPTPLVDVAMAPLTHTLMLGRVHGRPARGCVASCGTAVRTRTTRFG